MAPKKREEPQARPHIEQDSIDPERGVYVAADSDRAREAIVRSYRIIKVPDYFLDEWLPLLGPSRWLAALSFRQVAFVHKCKDKSGEQPTRTTYRELARWAGQSRPQMHKLLKAPQLLSWFVQPEEGVLGEHPGSRSERRTYLVRIEIPLTPADQARLQGFLKANQAADDEGWLQVLHEAISAKKEKAPPKTGLPKRPKSVQQMVRELRDPSRPLTEDLDWACDELLERWQSQNFGQVTHYFIKRWLPDLTPGLGCLVIWSRRHANRQPELQIGKLPNLSWRELAASVGVSAKTVQRWFSDHDRYPHTLRFIEPVPVYSGTGELRLLEAQQIELGGEQLSLGADTLIKHDLHAGDVVQAIAERRDGSFHAGVLQLADERDVASGLAQTGIRFDVKLSEPIHADDRTHYHELLDASPGAPNDAALLHATVRRPPSHRRASPGTNTTHWTEVDKARTEIENAPALASGPSSEVDKSVPEVDTSEPEVNFPQPGVDDPRSAVDTPGADVDALRGVLRDSPESIQVLQQERLQQPGGGAETQIVSEGSDPVVVATHPEQWDIDHILTQAGIPKRDRKAILRSQEATGQQFVGWLLWSLATKSIEAPVVHAVSRVKGGENAPDDFVELSAVPLESLERWIRTGGFECPSRIRKAVQDLRDNDALSELSRLGCIGHSESEVDEIHFWTRSDGDELHRAQEEITGSEHLTDEPLGDQGHMASEVWESVKNQLQHELPRAAFDTWLRDVQFERMEDGKMVLAVANEYARDWLSDRVSTTANQILAGIVGHPMEVEFTVTS